MRTTTVESMSGKRADFDADVGGGARRARAKTRHERRMQHEAEAGLEARPFAHVALEAAVTVRTPLYPTEERQKVEAGVRALFPDAEFEAGALEVRAKAKELTRMAEILRHSRIRDTARSQLMEALTSPTTLRFNLNKQAACAARVNFVGRDQVLGALEVEIEAPDAAALAEELTWIEGESDERLFGTKLHTLPLDRRRAAEAKLRGDPRPPRR